MLFSKITYVICLLSSIYLSDSKSTSRKQGDPFPLTILHVNDIHAHFEEVNIETGRCHDYMAEAGDCYGGMSRMYTLISELREQETNVLLLNAGDYYQGKQNSFSSVLITLLSS
jgi:2',3'-cyclic-nucleotide 2'-phosphodiesterase (5'-nucleotidase family)